MSLTAWAALLTAWIVAVASPGPDFLAVLRVSATAGRQRGLFVAVGVACGIAMWVLLALTGLSVIFAKYETAYLVVRYVGAAFLVAYGLRILISARRAGADTTVRADEGGDQPTPGATQAATPATATDAPAPLAAWRLGLLTNLANPKALVFFGALLASLIPHGAGLTIRGAVFAVIVGVAVAWFAAVAFVASHERVAGAYRRAARRIDAAVGTVFAGIGISLAMKA